MSLCPCSFIGPSTIRPITIIGYGCNRVVVGFAGSASRYSLPSPQLRKPLLSRHFCRRNMSLTPSRSPPYSYARHCTHPLRWETPVPEKRQGKKAKREKQVEVLGFLGVGLDSDEGHRRVTTGDNFVLVGG